MDNLTNEFFDAIVIGGGPGGSSAASFIAMQGHRVLLLERDKFPRHRIGESLLPATVHGICAMLGLKEEVDAAGFPRKRGGTFRWGASPNPWTFPFAQNTDAPGGYAYQVERARFDKMLLDNSRKKGVDVREEHKVHEITFTEGRASGVIFSDVLGQKKMATARFIVDAGGSRSSQYNPHLGEKIHSKFFQNIALYAYFENGKRLPAPNQGNMLSCAFKDGWFWYIPLSDTLTSVGVVLSRDAAKILQGGHDKAFSYFISQCPLIGEYLASATRITEGMYGEYRVCKDYSYCSPKFWRDGLILIGDAACFVDPVFSSGVHLATYAALLAARSINTCLKYNADEAVVFSEFERRYRREFGNFYQFLLAFYDIKQDKESYFWAARKVLNTEEAGNQAFVRLVAGLSSEEEPLFKSSDFFQARIGFGDWFEETVVPQSNGKSPAEPSMQAFDRSKFDPQNFMRNFTNEIQQVQLQAMFGTARPKEMPLASSGLVPSRDGFHWEIAPS